MAAPLMARKFDLDAGAFALGDRASKAFDQRLNVRKGDRCCRGLGEDRGERLAVSGVHGRTLAEYAITVRRAGCSAASNG